MKKLSTILMCLICANSFATTYFVSASGNDANNGTSTGAPWRTIAKVNTINFVAGDIISFHGGDTFLGFLTPTHSGASGNPITYNSYGSGNAIVTGLTSITAWTNLGGNIWESTAAVTTLTTLNMVVINGANTGMGRFPNSGYFQYQSFTGSTSITSSSLNSAVTNWTGAEVVLRSTPWLLQRQPITNHVGQTLTYPGAEVTKFVNYGFFIQNDARTLDVANEWYFLPGTKKLRIYNTVPPTNVQVASVDETILNSGANWITYDNLTIEGANTYLLEVRHGQHIVIQNCLLHFAGKTAMYANNFASASDIVLVNNNVISDNNESALKILPFSDVWTVTNNTINNTGMIPGMGSIADQQNTADAIDCNGAGSLIQNNIISNTGHIGISFRSSSNMTARNNYIFNSTQVRYDGGAIYSWNADTLTIASRFIDGNVCINNLIPIEGVSTADPIICGIYLDGSSKNTTITNNSVSGYVSEGIHILGSGSVTVTGNTCYNNGNLAAYALPNGSAFGMLHFTSAGGETINNLIVKNNIFFAKNANQFCFFYRNDDATYNHGYSDSNYFARPINDNLTFRTTVSFTNTDRSLAMWQGFASKDPASKKAFIPITNVSQLFFGYAIFNDSTLTLPAGVWVDVYGVSHSGTIFLSKFTSTVLTNTGASVIPPVANAGIDQTITWPGSSVSLSGSGTDADGVIVAYAWSKTSGGAATITNPASQNTSVTGLFPGSYQFQLQVTDNSGQTGTDNMTVTVNQGAASLSFSAPTLTQTYTGFPLSPVVNTFPAGLPVDLLFNGISTRPSLPGTYNLNAGIQSPESANWIFTPITGTFTINKGVAVISASNATVNFDGLTHSIVGTVTPTTTVLTATYTGISGTTYGPSTTPPSAIGTYRVDFTLASSTYTATPISVNLTIVSNPAIIFISDTLKTYNFAPQTVTVTSAYSFTLTGVPQTNAGVYPNVIATINDGVHVGADTATLTIAKLQSILSWTPPANMPDGSLLSPLQLNATASVAGHYVYDHVLGERLTPGPTIVTGTFVPDDPSNILGGTISRTINVFAVNPFLNFIITGPGGQILFIKQ